jgi:hypothetical protein
VVLGRGLASMLEITGYDSTVEMGVGWFVFCRIEKSGAKGRKIRSKSPFPDVCQNTQYSRTGRRNIDNLVMVLVIMQECC